MEDMLVRLQRDVLVSWRMKARILMEARDDYLLGGQLSHLPLIQGFASVLIT
jgi:hypothetical protein